MQYRKSLHEGKIRHAAYVFNSGHETVVQKASDEKTWFVGKLNKIFNHFSIIRQNLTFNEGRRLARKTAMETELEFNNT